MGLTSAQCIVIQSNQLSKKLVNVLACFTSPGPSAEKHERMCRGLLIILLSYHHLLKPSTLLSRMQTETDPDIGDQGISSLPSANPVHAHLAAAASEIADPHSHISQFETRKLPQKIKDKTLIAYGAPRDACFDIASWPESPGWAAQKRCEPCNAINALLHATSSDSLIGKSAVGFALLTTECKAEQKRKEVVPQLPVSVLQQIVAAYVSELTQEGRYSLAFVLKDSANVEEHGDVSSSESSPNEADSSSSSSVASDVSTICTVVPEDTYATLMSLMHASRRLRSFITQHLPVRLRLRWACFEDPSATIYMRDHFYQLHETFSAFITAAVDWFHLDAMGREPLAIPTCNDNLINNVQVASIQFEVSVTESEEAQDEYSSDKTDEEPSIIIRKGTGERQVTEGVAGLTVGDACEVLLAAFNNALPPPLQSNACYRISQWEQGVTVPRCSVNIRMSWPDLMCGDRQFVPIHWSFVESTQHDASH